MDFTCSKIQSSRFSAFSLGAKLNIEARELLSKLTKFYTVQYETQKSQFMKKKSSLFVVKTIYLVAGQNDIGFIQNYFDLSIIKNTRFGTAVD